METINLTLAIRFQSTSTEHTLQKYQAAVIHLQKAAKHQLNAVRFYEVGYTQKAIACVAKSQNEIAMAIYLQKEPVKQIRNL